ncbi:aldehyde dehydrogenase [Gamsiella multidivaricata]|uniref:aldehyde dehydrogenase n=1 Tax=Gamsiella multidivaricata TaxID=101098 RepID=UPI00221E5DF1|nr:aldehyde dehydrogenase [Gamsiella multidivaricata]KAI7821496.1 aldehyde dehydrogenase [Gamsiella multidivaricata]
MSPSTLSVVTPVDSTVFAKVQISSTEQVQAAVERAAKAQKGWKQVPLKDRVETGRRFLEVFGTRKDELAKELTMQMGRPLRFTPGEIKGTQDRGKYMVDIAEEALKDVEIHEAGLEGKFKRFIRKVPVGVVLIVAPWNYPYLSSLNGVLPSIIAGNAVILKHSSQTPLCGERFAQAWKEAGLPEDVFQCIHMSHADTESLVGHPLINYVNFTGSVEGGHQIQKAASKKFIATGLELGGKDPAYVRPDCDLKYTVETLVDGSFFNSGQCCCAVERIYVHADVYDEFLDLFVKETKNYRLGNPLDPETTLGPMVKAKAADFVRGQIAEAVSQGAKTHIDVSTFPADKPGTPYMAPQVLTEVTHEMRVMTEESFGPVIGIMKVTSDEEAIRLMNDSAFGLSASIWTKDTDAALKIGDQIETGTWFMNRCDYLDPALAWVGVKDSGRGCTLSKFGYDQVTRLKSFHLKLVTA